MAEPSMPGPPPAEERPTPLPPPGPSPEPVRTESAPPMGAGALPPVAARSGAGTVGVSRASGTSRHSLVGSWAVVLVGLILSMLFFWIGYYADPRAFLAVALFLAVIAFYARRIATTRREQRMHEASSPPGSRPHA